MRELNQQELFQASGGGIFGWGMGLFIGGAIGAPLAPPFGSVAAGVAVGHFISKLEDAIRGTP